MWHSRDARPCHFALSTAADFADARDSTWTKRLSLAILSNALAIILLLLSSVQGQTLTLSPAINLADVPTACGLGNNALAHHNQGFVNESGRHADLAQTPDTSKWKIYRNSRYGFQVKYPETWGVHPSTGTGAEITSLAGPFKGSRRPQLDLIIQRNMNPRKLSIEEWFADQQRLTGFKPAAIGRLSIGSQHAVFMENTVSDGNRRDVFTLLHRTHVLSFTYNIGTEDDPVYEAIIASFRVHSSRVRVGAIGAEVGGIAKSLKPEPCKEKRRRSRARRVEY